MLKQWFYIRDLLLGDNGSMPNVEKALDLARSCQHEDAIWLRETFDSIYQDLRSRQYCATIHDIFTRLRMMDDHRSDTFHAFLFPFDKAANSRLQKAAFGDYPFAQVLYAGKLMTAKINSYSEIIMIMDLLKSAITNGSEPRAYHFIVNYDRKTLGNIGLFVQVQYTRQAAKLGFVKAFIPCSFTYNKIGARTHKKYFYWKCMAALHHMDKNDFLVDASKCLTDKDDYNNKVNMYYIAKAMNTGDTRKLDEQGVSEEMCDKFIKLFLDTNEMAKSAIDTWSLIAWRNRVVKDVRLLVAKRLWKKRSVWSVCITII